MCDVDVDAIGNEIGPEGAGYISDALRENSTLLILHIQSEPSSFSFLFLSLGLGLGFSYSL